MPKPAAYTRTTWRGVTLNHRTVAMLEWAEEQAGVRLTPSQGSYNKGGVGASAGTHDGGGAVDLSTTGLSRDDELKVIKALRQAGFAAWRRNPIPNLWGEHIHAIAIGDRDLAPAAANQVTAYRNGRNGLADNGPDNAAFRPDPIPVFDYRAGRPDPAPKPKGPAVVRVSQVQPGDRGEPVKVVQKALLAEKLNPGPVDGIFGRQTREAYRAWQRRCGFRGTSANGAPGHQSLSTLGKKHGFTVEAS